MTERFSNVIYILKMLSLDKVQPVWSLLGAGVTPRSEVREIIRKCVRKTMGPHPMGSDYFSTDCDQDIRAMFEELNSIPGGDSGIGDTLAVWVESYVNVINPEPWKRLWKTLLYRTGRLRAGGLGGEIPEETACRLEVVLGLFAPSVAERYLELAEAFFERRHAEERQWLHIDALPWTGWDRDIYEDHFAFADVSDSHSPNFDLDRETHFGSPLNELDTYLELKAFSEAWSKVLALLGKEDLRKLNAWGMEEAKTMSYKGMINKDPEGFEKLYSFPVP